MKWQDLEKKVKQIASTKWGSEAISEELNGVKWDCILKVKKDYWIIIEISTENDLTKLRTDIAKIYQLKTFLIQKNIYAEYYFVTKEEPKSIRKSGEENGVNVLSYSELEAKFFDFSKYKYYRSQRIFGSAVDPISGEIDSRKYIPVKYVNIKTNDSVTLEEISQLLRRRKKIVLLGNYGTGKSRCFQELFSLMAENNESLFYPICINLKDNWGLQNTTEIISRHFGNLGLSSMTDDAIKAYNGKHLCLMLDGFDELGSQSWSEDKKKLIEIRRRTLSPIREMLSNANVPAIISGREHYFNSNQEMFDSLGLNMEETVVLRCSDEFTIDEMVEYLSGFSEDIVVPEWLPKRPLICQLLSGINDEEFANLFDDQGDSSRFWEYFLDELCKREARIHTSFDHLTIKNILICISRFTRSKANKAGPISMSEINKAFEKVIGVPPVDDSATMLQRLPTLGRTGPESDDRQFVDTYVLDGLCAEDTVSIVQNQEHSIANEGWNQNLGKVGISIVSSRIKNEKDIGTFLAYFIQNSQKKNKMLLGDIFAALSNSNFKDIDFKYSALTDSHIAFVNLYESNLKNIEIQNTVIELLDITRIKATGISIYSCIINEIAGITSSNGIPVWIKNSSVERYQSVSSATQVKNANLNNSQRYLVNILRKLFRQPGKGRKESVLIKGWGKYEDQKLATKIIGILKNENFITNHPGAEGTIYKPNRALTIRVDKILNELTISTDPIWKQIELLK